MELSFDRLRMSGLISADFQKNKKVILIGTKS